MLDELLQRNNEAFHLINGVWNSALLDFIMPWLRNKYAWAPLYLFIIGFMLLNYRWKGLMALLYLGITVLLCDQISSGIIKQYFEIPRPCNDPALADHIRLLVNCGSGFSFPSSHAANHFGTAVFLGVLFSRKRIILPVALLWAALISYAQIYVGVHYPLDIAGGALLGATIGLLTSFLCKWHLGNDFLF